MAYNYPYGNGQQLNLDWFLNEWKNLLAAWEAEKNGIEGALQAEIDKAEAALADVFAARDAAAQSAANALESKNAAAESASDASGYLATVRADANTASNAAQNAAQSESNAAESAQTALASKNTAAQSERNAAQSEANALASKNAAAQSAEDALANKNAAAQSAEDALANKNAAAQSAEDASDAAASVEASAEQISTNTNNINYFSKLLPSAIFPLNKMRQKPYTYASVGRRIENNGGIYTINFTQTGNPTIIISGNPQDNISQAGTGTDNDAIHFVKGNYKVKAVILNTDNQTSTYFMFNIVFKLPNTSATFITVTIEAGKNIVEKPITISEDVDLCVFIGMLTSYLGTTSFVLTFEPVASTALSTNALNVTTKAADEIKQLNETV